MKFTIVTLFPEMFSSLDTSILKRAKKKGLIDINLVQLRDFASDKHKTVDDTPYGGGVGMVLKVDVVDKAISKIKNQISKTKNARVVMLSASGTVFTQQKALELAKYDEIILLCGHYEGFDQRVHDYLVDEEISIGEYVLTGGEIPAMVIVDTVSRMIPGVIKEESAQNESFMDQETRNKKQETNNSQYSNTKSQTICSEVKDGFCKNLTPITYKLTPNHDFPCYTRPAEYNGWKVPEVLLSGNHKEIEKWRNKQR